MIRTLAFLVFVAAATCAGGEDISLRSPSTEVKLLELYTSEGCSSCPRADRWLAELEQDARLWDRVVPVAFHVDYWDYIGWRDRFARPEFSDRQRQYARQGIVSTVYTPGFVLGGREWREWFHDPNLELGEVARVGELQIDVQGNRARAMFLPLAALDLPDLLELNFAVLGFDLMTEVKGGENEGRSLSHDFVVLAYGREALENMDGSFHRGFDLPAPQFPTSKMALAAWVSLPGDPRPIQAVGGWLTP